MTVITVRGVHGLGEHPALHDTLAESIEDLPGTAGIRRLEPDDRRVADGLVDILFSVVISGEFVVWLIAWYSRIKRLLSPLVVVDATKDLVQIEVRDDLPALRGRLIVRTRDGEEVVIDDASDSVDVAELLRNILGREV